MTDETADIRQKPVQSDSSLESSEKELALNFPNDRETGTIHTEIPTLIKWVLSVKESEIYEHRTDSEGNVVSVTARIPKGIIKLKGKSRKSNNHSQMVSYGEER